MKLKKQVKKAVANEFDSAITNVEIAKISDEDQAVFCDLYVGEEKIVSGRVFPFDTFPCDALSVGEKEFVEGKEPNEKWFIPEIKQWLDVKNPDSYSKTDTKEVLLSKIAPVKELQEINIK